METAQMPVMADILRKIEVPIQIPGTTVPYETVQPRLVPVQRLTLLEETLMRMGLSDPLMRLIAGIVVVDGIIFMSKPDWAFDSVGRARVWRPKAGYTKRAQDESTWVPWWVPGIAAGVFLGLFV